MPPIKRWHPVSHDLNADPEVWAMRHQIGEKSLSIWLEFLSIADRNEGQLPGDLDELIRLVSGRCQASQRTVRGVYEFALSRVWLDCEPTLRIAKYAKYHRSREPNKAPSEPDRTEPNHIKNKNKNKKAQAPLIKIPDWMPLENWNGFLEHRKRIRKPVIGRAMSLAIKNLETLKNAGNDPASVLDQSVSNGWTGLFELKKGEIHGTQSRQSEPKGFESVRGFLALHNKP